MTRPSNLFRPTRHAAVRAQQRSVNPQVLTQVFLNADIELPAGGGCRSLEISADMMFSLMSEGHPIHEIESARRVVLIVDGGNGIVTVIRRAPPCGAGRRPTNRRRPSRVNRGGV